MNDLSGIRFGVPALYRALWATLLLTGLAVAHSGRAADLPVSSAADILNKASQARPGDTLIMNDGVWQNADIAFSANGTPSNPITLRAQTLGRVLLGGTSRLRISGSYLVVDGLLFTNGFVTSGEVISFQTTTFSNAYNCRLTNCAIVDYNPPDTGIDTKWVSLYGASNRVENCYFKGKSNLGSTIAVWVDSQPNSPNYHRIAHNYFGFRAPLGVNGGETIRVGTSDVSMNSSATSVEYNYFERCNGDAEYISSKSLDNLYRFNTFVECEGALSLRHGNRCTVEGNYFLGNNKINTGGVRIVGEDHKVYNNYFADLRGTASRSPVSIMQGLVDSPLNGYFQVKRATVAFNTFVNCTNSLLIGLSGTLGGTTNVTTLPPVDCVIANNIVLAPKGKMVDQRIVPENLLWEGNLMFGTTLGITPVPSGINQIDPLLVQGADGLFRPANTSPALGGAQGVYDYVTQDFEGHSRTGAKDIGCDQASTSPVVRPPLTPADVGPLWMRVRGTVLSWNNPGDMFYGTPLGATQLNATANAPGTFIYNPGAGTILNVGPRTLSVIFIPNDLVNFNAATQTVTINVLPAAPVIVWPTPTNIYYGTALGAGQLNASTTVAGTMVYLPPAGTVLSAGNGQILTATFTPLDTVNYTVTTRSVNINVLPAIPVITWNNPLAIASGTALSAVQLNATANVAGIFVYTPPLGTVLNAGSAQSLLVTFYPEDHLNYAITTRSVLINVTSGGRVVPIITWPTPATIVFGTPLGAAQLNATANVPGTFAYTPPAGTVLNAGSGQILSVIFTPTDTGAYTLATNRVTINVANPAVDAKLRVAYLIPANRVAQTGAVETLRSAVLSYQQWFSEQMVQNGFGPKTFVFETEADEVTPRIYVVTLPQTDSYLRGDLKGGRVVDAARAAGIPLGAPGHLWWLIPETHVEYPDGSIAGGFDFGYSYGGSANNSGWAMMGSESLALCPSANLTNAVFYEGSIVPEIGPYPLQEGVSFSWFDGTTMNSISSSALGSGLRQIGEGLGLCHDFRNDENFNGNLMGYGFKGLRGNIYPKLYPYNFTRLSYGAALALNVSPYFNPGRPVNDSASPSVNILTSGAQTPVNGLLRITFAASDAGGLYGALLAWKKDADEVLVDEMVLSGNSATRTFAIPYFDPGQTNEYVLSVFDGEGNTRRVTTFILPASTLNHSPQPFLRVSPATVGPGEDVVLDVSSTFDPEHSSDLLEVEWDLDGDGIFDTERTTALVVTNNYLEMGSRLIRARITDPAGDEAVSAPIAVNVTPCAAVLSPVTRTNGFGTGGSTVNVRTGDKCNWSVVSLTDWITITSATNFTGSNQVTYAVEANPNFTERSGRVAIADQIFIVVQRPVVCTYSLSPTSRFTGFGGGSGTIKVTTGPNCAWSVVNTNPWVLLTSNASGIGPATVGYSMGENRVAKERIGMLVIGDAVFTVGQWGTNCAFVLNVTNRLHGEGMETGLVSVSAASGCFWNVDNPHEWIILTAATSGSGSGSVAYRLLPNESLAPRTGVLTIGGERFTLTQLACSYNLSPETQVHGSLAETGIVTVATSGICRWSVSNPNSWISVLSVGPGIGAGVVTYRVEPNPGSQPRQGVVNIAGHPFTVIQAGVDCSYDISPTEWSHGEGEEAWEVSVMTADDCPWTVVSTADWIIVLSGTSGTGPGSIIYKVRANTGPDRSGALIINGLEFLVEQARGLRIAQPGDIVMSVGQTNCLSVKLETHGSENSVTFSLCYDASAATFVSAKLGTAAAGGRLVVDNSQAALGRLGFSILMPLGWSLSPGMPTLVDVCFRGNIVTGIVTSTVSMCDTPTARRVFDVLGQSLPVTYLNGSIRVVGECSIGVSVDAPQFSWVSDGDVPWTCQTNVTHDGVDAAWSGLVADGGESYIETTVAGPGVLSFWWKVSSEPSNDRLRLYMDGSEQLRISGEVDWEFRTFSVPSGNHVVRWRYTKSSSIAGGLDRAWVDEVRFDPAAPMVTSLTPSQSIGSGSTVVLTVAAAGTPPIGYQWQFNGLNLTDGPFVRGATTASLTLSNVQTVQAGAYSVLVSNGSGSVSSSNSILSVFPTIPLPEAVDAPSLAWTTTGTPTWFGQPMVSHDGQDAAQSGLITHSQTTSFQTTVNGPGSVTFWWKVSSEPSNDRLYFYIGSSEQTRITGEVDWEERSFTVPSGSQVLKWTYSKNSSTSSGQDRGWVDQIRFGPTPAAITAQPVGSNVDAGSAVTFAVTATGAAPLTYQWRLNGVNLSNGPGVSGATNATLTLTNVQPDKAGDYSVVVANGGGSVTSSNALLTVTPLLALAQALDTTDLVWTLSGSPPWVGQPLVSHDGEDAARSGAISDSGTTSFQTTVNGPGTVSFWWKVSSEPSNDRLYFYIGSSEQTRITGEVDWQWRQFSVSSGSQVLRWTYSKNSSTTAGQDRGWVDQVLYISNGAPVTPIIAIHPISQTVVAPTTVNFRVQAAGSAPLGYQWLCNGTNLINSGAISGATTTNLTVSNAQLAQAGLYSVVVSNAAGMVASSNALLTVITAPIITNQPSSQNVIAGTTVNFAVGALGTAPLSYQWRLNGNNLSSSGNISGATTAALKLSSVTAAQAGSYSVVVSNASGSVTSSAVTLLVSAPPVLTLQPANRTVNAGTSFTFIAAATGTAPLIYQWRFAGTNLLDGGSVSGATTPGLTLSNIQAAQAGNYSVVISNAVGGVASSNATLTVILPPTISNHPVPQNVADGSNVTFSVVVAGTAPFGYQWRFNGTNLVNGGSIGGATTASLTVSAAHPIHAGSYSVAVSNPAGTVLSSNALLKVLTGLTLSEAVDATYLNWNTSLSAPWVAQTNVTYDGSGAARSGNISSNQISWLETMIEGPGTLRFWWKVSSQTNQDYLLFYVNGVMRSSVSGEVNWEPRSFDLPAGIHMLRWAYVKDASGTNGQDRGWVDAVVFTPNFGPTPPVITSQPQSQDVDPGANVYLSVDATGAAPLSYQWVCNGVNLVDSDNISGATSPTLSLFNAQAAQQGTYTVVVRNTYSLDISSNAFIAVIPNIPMAEALDTSHTNLIWIPGGFSAWRGQTDVSYDRLDSAQSGVLPNNQTNWVETTVLGPGAISFWWKVSSETNRDRLQFSVNGVEQASLSGEVDWRWRTFDVGAGSQRLRWAYIKDAAGSAGRDRGWVDQVVFGPSAPVITNQPAELTIVTAGTTVKLRVDASGSEPFSYQWRLNGMPLTNGGNIEGATGSRHITLTNALPWQAGTYTIAVSNSAGIAISEDAVVVILSGLSLPEALNTKTNYFFDTGGYTYWYGQTNITHDGAIAARSGTLPNGQRTWMEFTNIHRAGTLTFWWKVSSETNHDFLSYYVDDVLMGSISGEVGWTSVTNDIPTYGIHVVRWEYAKDSLLTNGLDSAFVDEVDFGSLSPIITNQPVSQIVDAGSTVTFSVGSRGTPPLSYQWRLNANDLADGGSINGARSPTLRLTGVQPSQAGIYTVVVTHTNTSGIALSSNAVLSVTPIFSLAEALDAPLFVWTTSGSPPWVGQPVVNHDGVDSARIASLADGGSASFQTTLVGPGTATFWWKTSSETNKDMLQFFIGSSEQARLSGEVDWVQRSFSVPSGNQTLKWTYVKNSSLVAGQDRAWVDQFQFIGIPVTITTEPTDQAVDVGSPVSFTVVASGTPPLTYQWQRNGVNLVNGSGISGATNATLTLSSAQLSQAGEYAVLVGNSAGTEISAPAILSVTPLYSLAEALDTPTLTWTTSGSPAWLGQGIVTHDGVDAGRSGPIGDSTTTSMQTTVNGPGTVSFWWKVSSQTNNDYLIFYLNSTELARISGEVGWQLRSFDVSSGSQTFRWTYSKNSSTAVGQDKGWVDQVQFGLTPPMIAVQPVSQNVDAGSTVNLNVSSAGTPPLSYQWKLNGVNLVNGSGISGATSSNLTLTAVQPSQAGNYSVVVSNMVGSVTSATAALTVTPLFALADALDTTNLVWTTSGTPVWVGHPGVTHDGTDAARSGAIADSGTTSFQTTVNGPGTVSFWWKVSSEPSNDRLYFYIGSSEQTRISGEVDWEYRTFSVPSGSQTLKWTYSKNSSGTAGLDKGWVDQVQFGPTPPSISAQPVSRNVDAGSNVTFSVTAAGAPPLGYQWRYNGNNLVNGNGVGGATTATLTLTNVQPAQAGNYSVVVSNSAGTITSADAVLAVATVIPLAEALDATNLIWTVGGEVPWVGQTGVTHDGTDAGRSGAILDDGESLMETTVTGPGTLRWWWKVSSEPSNDRLRLYLDGSSTLTISGEIDWEERTLAISSGNHVVRWRYYKNGSVSAGQDRGWVDQVQFGVVPPTITTQPIGRTVNAGTNVTFSVVVTGGTPLSYQWRLNGVNLSDGSLIRGATTASLTLSNVQSTQSGNYSVLVSNSGGSLVSSNAALTVIQLLSLAEALDISELPWSTTGTPPWTGQTSTSFDGVDAAQSGAIGDNQTTSLETTINGPGVVIFYWKVSSQPASDPLIFYIGNTEQARISGEMDWQFRTFSVPSGSQALRWTYSKNSSSAAGQDKAWVDQVAFAVGASPDPGLPGEITVPALPGTPSTSISPAIVMSGSKVVLTWDANGNKTYQVFYKDNLADPDWKLVDGEVLVRWKISETGAVMTDAVIASLEDVLAGQTRFYRILEY